jgi:peptide/nickel transport system permease protein
MGGAARFVRSSLRDLRDAPFLVVARARGLSRRQVIIRHQLRNGLIPVITLLGLSLPALFSGTVFVEAIFAWPGVGQVLVQAVQGRDYPVVMAAATVSAVLVVIGNLLAELLVGLVDPRTRSSNVAR